MNVLPVRPGKVVLVKSPLVGTLIDEIAAGLAGFECEIALYQGSEAFSNSPAPLADADVLIAASTLKVSRALLQAAPRLRAVLSCITGTDGFDEQAATELGIAVGNAPVPETHESMAEATVMLMLACLYDLKRTESILRNNLPRPLSVHARMLKGRTIGFVGFGRIARATIERLQGWGSTIRVYSSRAQVLPDDIKQMELDELLSTSDIIVVSTSLNPTTQNLLNADRLERIKPGAIFINIARGGIVDEAALYRLAHSGHLGMLALDVFATEPLPADSPLRSLPNAILTPHMVGHTHDIARALPPASVENVRRVLVGQPPTYLRNPEVLPQWTARWGDKQLVLPSVT